MTRRIPSEEERIRLSKKIAGLLRHYGPRYGLRIDREGWARIEDLVRALRRIPGFEWVSREHVLEVVSLDDKGRYEVRGDRIRARYGHSLPVAPRYEEAPAPRVLYHGTVVERLPGIRARGILPMKRRMVHLSASIVDAWETGRRHGGNVVVLVVDTSCLERRGVRVYRASPRVYVAEWVPPECIAETLPGTVCG